MMLGDPTAGQSAVRLSEIGAAPVSVDRAIDAVRDPRAGGLVVFLGIVRDHDAGQPVQRLEYSSHPTAESEMSRIMDEVAAAHDLVGLAAVHRVGRLEVGEIAVVAAVSAAHRDAAFAGARELIDRLKHEVPLWKQQEFADGTTEWVNLG